MITHSVGNLRQPYQLPPQTTKSNNLLIVWSEEPDYDRHNQLNESTGSTLDSVIEALLHRLSVIDKYEDGSPNGFQRQIARDHLVAAKEAITKSWGTQTDETPKQDTGPTSESLSVAPDSHSPNSSGASVPTINGPASDNTSNLPNKGKRGRGS